MADTASGGTLVRLPGEIRGEIYRLLFCESYLVFRPSFTSIDDIVNEFCSDNGFEDSDSRIRCPKDGPNHRFADLAILRISKVISAEASAILYSKSSFRYDLCLMEFGDLSSTSFPTQDIAGQFMNVRFTIDDIVVPGMGALVDLVDGMNRICGASISKFTGARALGNRFSIYFQDTEKPANPRSGSYIVMQALKEVTGFRLVVVEFPALKRWGKTYQDPRRIREKLVATLLGKFETAKETIRMELEPALGPAVDGSGLAIGSAHSVSYLEFHPYDYLTREQNSTGARV